MATYKYDEPMSRDFPGAPNRLRVPPELGGFMGNYMANCPPMNLNPPRISTLLMPGSTAISNAVDSVPPPSGIGMIGLLGLGALAFLMFGKPQRNGGRRKNVEMGYWVKAGGKRFFHPIRASYDYDRKRAGEGRKRTTRKKARRRRR